ncbi:hypothetical protein Nepgr_026498 [Nepenthes gracilis]|uniref:Uncharacterized protein n=1 Tax=Nepenthes gracilis TaxID=150966 RepID=A0AAD3T7X6_NEPGR|nr:hypothetical protein Nepgr_026498 [Nepenthes gracilis]
MSKGEKGANKNEDELASSRRQKVEDSSVSVEFTGEVSGINAENAQAEGGVSAAPTSVAEVVEAEVGVVAEPSSEVPAGLPAVAVQADQGEAHDEEIEGAQDLCVAEEEEAAAPSIAVESTTVTPHAGVPLSEAEAESQAFVAEEWGVRIGPSWLSFSSYSSCIPR